MKLLKGRVLHKAMNTRRWKIFGAILESAQLNQIDNTWQLPNYVSIMQSSAFWDNHNCPPYTPLAEQPVLYALCNYDINTVWRTNH